MIRFGQFMSLVERLLKLFNIDKCKILHVGSGNLNELYNMEGRPLEAVYEERDLGITITKDLKYSKQYLIKVCEGC